MRRDAVIPTTTHTRIQEDARPAERERELRRDTRRRHHVINLERLQRSDPKPTRNQHRSGSLPGTLLHLHPHRTAGACTPAPHPVHRPSPAAGSRSTHAPRQRPRLRDHYRQPTLLTAYVTVNEYGCEPACVSVVPSSLESQLSNPENPNDAIPEPNDTGTRALATPSAPPPRIDTTSSERPTNADGADATRTGIANQIRRHHPVRSHPIHT